ncbi:MAG: hypothetical protein U5K69_22565 [Balneolaceae bacterium]|nr:hypothetical protein [Balneolaceae bacterium]
MIDHLAGGVKHANRFHSNMNAREYKSSWLSSLVRSEFIPTRNLQLREEAMNNIKGFKRTILLFASIKIGRLAA